MNLLPISDEDLHAFIDGELAPARAADVARAIEHDAVLSRRVAAFRADKIRLKEVYAPLMEHPIPDAWLRMIDPLKLQQPPRIDRRAWMAMAASVVAIAGGWTAYRSLTSDDDEDVITAAIASRSNRVGLRENISADDAGALMSQTLGLRLKAPDLSKRGFSLTAANVYAAANKRAVKLDYRDVQSRVFTLYLTPSSGTPRFEMLRRSDLRICVWQDDVLGTIMLADVSAGEMLRLASLAYSGLNA